MVDQLHCRYSCGGPMHARTHMTHTAYRPMQQHYALCTLPGPPAGPSHMNRSGLRRLFFDDS
eukprot:COSAG01_NODE_2442_length_7689_cov_89.459289_7_plen_62_part_00